MHYIQIKIVIYIKNKSCIIFIGKMGINLSRSWIFLKTYIGYYFYRFCNCCYKKKHYDEIFVGVRRNNSPITEKKYTPPTTTLEEVGQQNNITIELPIVNSPKIESSNNDTYKISIVSPSITDPLNEILLCQSNIKKEMVVLNLKAIANLKKNQKLWISENQLAVHDGFSSWVPGMRWMNSQSRDILLPCIKETIYVALSSENIKDTEIVNLLPSVKNGLQILATTYDTKKEEINVLLGLIDNSLGTCLL